MSAMGRRSKGHGANGLGAWRYAVEHIHWKINLPLLFADGIL